MQLAMICVSHFIWGLGIYSINLTDWCFWTLGTCNGHFSCVGWFNTLDHIVEILTIWTNRRGAKT